MKLIECVPNFSEGRDRTVIDAITAAMSGVKEVRLLDVDPGQATNRTVVTLLGPPGAVLEAAFRGIAQAAQSIDMTRHQGAHPRMGATDVCPFIPVQDVDMDECVGLARRLGQRVGGELDIPVYLYGHSATCTARRALPDIRKGEYEALPEKLKRPDFQPDFGAARFNPRSGATAIGAREFLIAWNINLNTMDRRLATRIAAELRETGKLQRDTKGAVMRDAQGKGLRVAGRFKELQGGGWYIDEYQRAQVSFNLTNYKVTPLHAVFEACRQEARKLGLRVTGSELVGLVPLNALLETGDHYLALQGRTTGCPESRRIRHAVMSLGLDDLAPFHTGEKIMEYRYRGTTRGLRDLSLVSFTDELSTDAAAPGGGSAAALCGSLAAALSSMVASLTWSKKGLEARRETMEQLGRRAQELKDALLQAVDRDTEAYSSVLEAHRLPRVSTAQQQARKLATQAACLLATQVPLEVLGWSVEVLDLALQVAAQGAPAAASDAGVAGLCALAAAEGAALNVRINLPSLEDRQRRQEMDGETSRLLERGRLCAASIRHEMDRLVTAGEN